MKPNSNCVDSNEAMSETPIACVARRFNRSRRKKRAAKPRERVGTLERRATQAKTPRALGQTSCMEMR